ncbi:MAG: DUF192 domain-containing protein [Elusimicrobiota bacterium]
MKLFNLTKNKVVVENLSIAENYFERAKGLLGRKDIKENEGLLIKNCNWIHMFFMCFPIDVIFMKTRKCHCESVVADEAILWDCHGLRPRNDNGTEDTDVIAKQSQGVYKVVKILYNVKSWRISPLVFQADSVLEIKSGIFQNGNVISVGDELKIIEIGKLGD